MLKKNISPPISNYNWIQSITCTVHRCRLEIQEVVGSAKVSVADMPSLPFLQVRLSLDLGVRYVSSRQRLRRYSDSPVSVQYLSLTTLRAPPRWGSSSSQRGQLSSVTSPSSWTTLRISTSPRSSVRTGSCLQKEGKALFSNVFLTWSLPRYMKNERLIPFGVGRRYCMGEQLARNEIFIFLADLLQQLRWGEIMFLLQN